MSLVFQRDTGGLQVILKTAYLTACIERLQPGLCVKPLTTLENCPRLRVEVPPTHRHIKYSLDFLRPIKTAEAFEAVNWLADRPIPQRTWPQAGRR